MLAMKQCPECSADYDDNVSFCAKDGRSLVAVSTAASRLCPHCANSIAEDAAQCPYCKADLGPAPAPEWLIRDEGPFRTRAPARKKTVMPKIALIAGIVLCVIAAALFAAGIFGNVESRGTQGLLEQKTRELQAKDDQIKATEAELDKLRLEAADVTKESVALKARLDEREKELAASEQRLQATKRELERASTRRAQVEPRSNPQPVERVSVPTRSTQRQALSGVYETVKATEVHEQPAQSSRVITRINGGTRINVVRSDGTWLEIVSKRGNPPGYILRDHARLASTAN